MPELHRATPEQWANQKLWAQSDDDSACLIDLRARVEALEAAQLEQAESNRFCVDAIVRRVEALESAQQDKLDRLIALDQEAAMDELRAASAEARPCGLVERVANAIYNVPHDSAAEARAAIREVAKWLRENKYVAPTMDQRLFESEATTTADIAAESASIIVALIEQEADRG
jgi:hypothetical protein